MESFTRALRTASAVVASIDLLPGRLVVHPQVSVKARITPIEIIRSSTARAEPNHSIPSSVAYLIREALGVAGFCFITQERYRICQSESGLRGYRRQSQYEQDRKNRAAHSWVAHHRSRSGEGAQWRSGSQRAVATYARCFGW